MAMESGACLDRRKLFFLLREFCDPILEALDDEFPTFDIGCQLAQLIVFLVFLPPSFLSEPFWRVPQLTVCS